MEKEGSGYTFVVECVMIKFNYTNLLLFYTASNEIENGAIQNCLKCPPLHTVMLCKTNVWRVHVKPTEVQNNLPCNNIKIKNKLTLTISFFNS